VRPRHNCVSLLGLDPFTGDQKEYWIEKDLIEFYYKRGMLGKFRELQLVKEILPSPAVVFEGLKRESQEKSLCFAEIASHAYSASGHRKTRPNNQTFAVFVLSNDKIFRWGWEAADKNGTYPLDYKNRFTCQIWPKI
jgi:hypothetical protein